MTYYIKVEPRYYDSSKQPYLVTYGHLEEGDYDEIVKFETVEEAQKVIDKLQDYGDCYLLDHNEYSPPDYTIIQRKDIGDDCEDAVEELEGAVLGQFEYMMTNDYNIPDDVKYILDNSYLTFLSHRYETNLYFAKHKHYIIIYCPKVLAIQLKGGDLGNINWDKPAYFM
jgi:hypothetical protein